MNAVFFPRNDYPSNIEVCTHRHGKKMTYTECTDQFMFDKSYDWIVTLAKASGIKLSFFGRDLEFALSNFQTKALIDLQNDDIWIDIYSYCAPIASIVSQGGVVSQSEWLDAYHNYLKPSFMNALGKKPVALSYSYGDDTFQDYVCPLFLAARNSLTDNNTDYGVGNGNPNNIPYSVSNYKSKASTTRWYDSAKIDDSYSQKIADLANLIDDTMLNGGWIRNFTHFHSVYDDGKQNVYSDYFDMLATKNANNDIHFSGYGEAVAYLVFRQLITKVVMYSPIGAENDKLIIRLETKNNLNIDTDLLQIPISVKFSTAGTPLEGQNIKCSHNLISLGNNQYIVEIPYFQYPAAIIDKLGI